ncbi:MAG: ATP-binding protein [Bacteriovoracaceae bacterium]|jgi:predicted AAA+ superfamily ATPase|nr:ATP-binding protein [Bacteriovoracaceae bacterium]
MIKREVFEILCQISKGYPVVAITGPRQSGKTTLARLAFPEREYVSLETPSTLDFALNDPKGFLEQYKEGAIFDEAQNAPLLFSYLQEIVDTNKVMGQFILTGSQQFGLLSGITQSLAGRVGLVELMPLSINELEINGGKYLEQIIKGFYPSIYDRDLDPRLWYEDYIKTYVERDVRKLINIKDLKTFRNFIRLCAARNAQLLNISELCEAADINRKTAESWLSILEASYIIYFLQPHFKNFSKRVVKSAKLYFYDTGLAAFLLGLRREEELYLSSFKGALFESLIVTEIKKWNMNHRKGNEFYFWRDNKGIEVDLLYEVGDKINAIEIKSGETIHTSSFKSLKAYEKYAGSLLNKKFIIYGGANFEKRTDMAIFPWYRASEILNDL